MDKNTKSTIIEASLYDLLPSPQQPRVDESEGIEELKESISSLGLINKPKVLIHPKLAGKYIIQTGHRRVKAMKALSYQTTEVELLSEEDPRIPLVDNMLRVDLHVIELANAITTGIEDGIFLDVVDVANTTGISKKEINSMLKYGNQMPSYVISHLLETKKYVYSSSSPVLESLAELAKLKPGKKIIMLVLNDIQEREDEAGANIKLFMSLIQKEIDQIKQKEEVAEEEVSEEQTQDPVDKKNEDSSSFLEDDEEEFDLDEEFDEEIVEFDNNADGSSPMDHSNTISDLGLKVFHDDDWREVTLKININEMSGVSVTKAISVLEKLRSKLDK